MRRAGSDSSAPPDKTGAIAVRKGLLSHYYYTYVGAIAHKKAD